MLSQTDVFVTNMRPKSLIKAGLDGNTLLKRFPQLIHATITGFGDEGPEKDNPGFDGIGFWAKSGFLRDMSLNTIDYYPVLAPTGAGDTITGLSLYGAIVTALYKREKTGEGDIVTTSLYANAIWSMCSMIIRGEDKYKETFPKERREDHPLTCPYKCADGEWLAITILEHDRYAPVLFDLLGVSKKLKEMGILVEDDLSRRREEVIPILQKVFLTKPVQEWVELLTKSDIVCCKMNHFSDVSKDEQAWANGYVETMRMRNGEDMVMPRTPVKVSSSRIGKFSYAPMPGENTYEILEQFGFKEEEIQDLFESKSVK
jgi:crotonobetainyl-CoA:carnitine CoA-transferase CaiB-like acyl-CoA transferase